MHNPREACLRAYLSARAGPGALRLSTAVEVTYDWAAICERVASATGGDPRLELHHRLTAALRGGAAEMQHEEQEFLARTRERISATSAGAGAGAASDAVTRAHRPDAGRPCGPVQVCASSVIVARRIW